MPKLYLAVILIPLLAESAFANPTFLGSKYPQVSNTDTDLLPCYMQTADGRTINLGALCVKAPESSDRKSAVSQSVTSRDNSIDRFIARKCYLIDAAGHPCPNGN